MTEDRDQWRKYVHGVSDRGRVKTRRQSPGIQTPNACSPLYSDATVGGQDAAGTTQRAVQIAGSTGHGIARAPAVPRPTDRPTDWINRSIARSPGLASSDRWSQLASSINNRARACGRRQMRRRRRCRPSVSHSLCTLGQSPCTLTLASATGSL